MNLKGGMGNPVLIIIIVLVIIAGFFFFFNGGDSNVVEEQVVEEQTEVVEGENGAAVADTVEVDSTVEDGSVE